MEGGVGEELNHTTERDAWSSINHSILSAYYESFRFKTSDPEGWGEGGAANYKQPKRPDHEDTGLTSQQGPRDGIHAWFGLENAYFFSNRMDLDWRRRLLRFGGKSVCFLTRRALLRQTEQREESPGGVADQSKLRPRN
jgi:hypothetical protein